MSEIEYQFNMERKSSAPATGIYTSAEGITFHKIKIGKEWLLHREDGPAIIHPDGTQAWFYMNEHIPCSDQEEFKRRLNMRVFW